MKRLAIGLVLAVLATGSMAQYRCEVNGKTTYSDAPCAANARYVGALQDNVSQRAHDDAVQLRRNQARERARLDRDQDMAMRQGQQALQRQTMAEDAQTRAKASRCAEHRRSLARNQRDQAFYQDLGMQQSLTNRQQEARAINDSIFRECP